MSRYYIYFIDNLHLIAPWLYRSGYLPDSLVVLENIQLELLVLVLDESELGDEGGGVRVLIVVTELRCNKDTLFRSQDDSSHTHYCIKQWWRSKICPIRKRSFGWNIIMISNLEDGRDNLHCNDKAASSTLVAYGHSNLPHRRSNFSCRKNWYLILIVLIMVKSNLNNAN